MTQLETIINKCKTAINAGIPVIYIESDDIAIIDDILNSKEIVRFWVKEEDETNGDIWILSESGMAKNVYVGNRDLSVDWFSLCMNKCKRSRLEANADKTTLVTKDSDPWFWTRNHVPFVLGIRNYLPTRKDEYKDTAESNLINHVSRVISSHEDDDIRRCTIILQSPIVSIPKGIESYVEVIEVPKLDDKEITDIIVSFAKEHEEKPYIEHLERLVVNLRGFNPRKIREILERIYFECNGIFNIKGENEGISIIRSIKEQMLKKEGLLTLVKTNPDLSVSGLDNITNWLKERAELFMDPLKTENKWNLSVPKGILVSGIPGTGKSALANEIAKIFAPLPLLQFDMGSILGHYVGESEANMRRVLKLAESMSPCILWIDEIEKAFSSASSSGDADSGQGKRLFGQFLTWMQEKKAPCFIYATANEINKLPPEFFRRGRFDQKFYTFMPTKKDCIEIFKANFIRYNKGNLPFNAILSDALIDSRIGSLVEFCGSHGKFMIGADIEGIVNDAMFSYFSKYWRGRQNEPEAYEIDKFYEELKSMALKVKTYGETDMDKIADRLLLLAAKQFTPTTSNNLISLDDVNLRNISIPEYKGKWNKDNDMYDKRLYDKIKAEIEFMQRIKNNRQHD